MPVFDLKLMFRSAANLTTSESNGPLTIRGTTLRGLSGRVVVPSSEETTASVLPRYWVSDDNTTYYLAATYHSGAQSLNANGASGVGPIELITPIKTDKKYVKEELKVVGTTGTSFGPVRSGLTFDVGYDWDRTTHFE